MQDIKKKLATYISEKRYSHTLNVVEKATELANAHNIDHDKAYYAALIHDAAKEFSPDKCRQKNIKLDDYLDTIYKNYKPIWHALIIDQFAAIEFDIKDNAVLEAAKWHTTGHPNMSTLAKIIFIADYIDPLRGFTNQNELEKLAKESLNDAMAIILIKTIHFISLNQQPIYEATIACYNKILLDLTISKNKINELLKL